MFALWDPGICLVPFLQTFQFFQSALLIMGFTDPAKQREWRARNKDKVREYQRKWAASPKGQEVLRQRELRKAGTIQSNARRMITNRVIRKKMPPASFFLCTDCDKRAEHYHHEDYSIWWSVEPLCHSCHGKKHRKY